MDTQSYDASRLYSTETGPYCSSWDCPRCSCPSGKSINDTWYHEWQEQYNVEENTVKCSLCECRDDGNGVEYVSCEQQGSSYTIAFRECGASSSTTISCHSADSASRM